MTESHRAAATTLGGTAESPVAERFPAPLDFDLSREDYAALSLHVSAGTEVRWLTWPVLLLISVVPTVLVAVTFPGYGPGFLAGACTAIGGLVIRAEQVRSRAAKARAPRPDGVFLGKRTIVLGADGLKITSPRSATEMRWTAVLAVTETEQHIFLQVDTVSALVIPKRAFDSGESCARFAACIRKQVSAHATA